MYKNDELSEFESILTKIPDAWANIRGSEAYPSLMGIARFYNTPYGTLAAVEVEGLPAQTNACNDPIFAVHVHEGDTCTGNADDPFANTRTHYNPNGCPHPYHAGDMPPILGANGRAFSVFLTDRFTADEIVGRTIIIHSTPDDFTSQPSGNSGMKIACGEIMGRRR